MNPSEREAARKLAESFESWEPKENPLLTLGSGVYTPLERAIRLKDALLSALSWGEETDRENGRLREALRYYARRDVYRMYGSGSSLPIFWEGGDKARAALSPERKEAP